MKTLIMLHILLFSVWFFYLWK